MGDGATALSAEARRAIAWECQQLSIRAFNLVDARAFEALGRLYTEDAVFVRPTAPDDPIEGREAILASYAARPADRLTRHVCANFQVDVSGPDRASSFYLVVLYTGDRTKPAPRIGALADPSQLVGEFRDEYVLTDDGWRIAKRIGTISLATA